MTPEERQEVHDLVQRIRHVTRGKLLVLAVPSDWTDADVVRLSVAMGRAMRAGPTRLRAIERAVRG